MAVTALRFGTNPEIKGKVPLEAKRLLIAGFLIALLAAVELVLFSEMGWSYFGWIHLAYLNLYLVLPLLAVLVLRLKRRWQATRASRAVAWLALVPVPILTYATFVEPFDLRVESTSVQVGHTRSKAPIIVGLLADLQAERVTDYERDAVAQLMEIKPDLILISGDIIQQASSSAYMRVLPEFTKLLGELRAPGGVFMVRGNVDPAPRLEALIAGTNVTLLDNKVVDIAIKGRRIALGGVDLGHSFHATGEAVIKKLERSPADIRLLLAHLPDAVLALAPNSSIDMVLAGHTHGGQVTIPFFGPPITLSSVPRLVAAGGLNQVNGNSIYVSRGVGLERGSAPRLRFLCPPELSILKLR